jgi:hypothetical protein
MVVNKVLTELFFFKKRAVECKELPKIKKKVPERKELPKILAERGGISYTNARIKKVPERHFGLSVVRKKFQNGVPACSIRKIPLECLLQRKLRVPYIAENFLTSYVTTGLLRKTLPCNSPN